MQYSVKRLLPLLVIGIIITLPRQGIIPVLGATIGAIQQQKQRASRDASAYKNLSDQKAQTYTVEITMDI